MYWMKKTDGWRNLEDSIELKRLNGVVGYKTEESAEWIQINQNGKFNKEQWRWKTRQTEANKANRRKVKYCQKEVRSISRRQVRKGLWKSAPNQDKKQLQKNKNMVKLIIKAGTCVRTSFGRDWSTFPPPADAAISRITASQKKKKNDEVDLEKNWFKIFKIEIRRYSICRMIIR